MFSFAQIFKNMSQFFSLKVKQIERLTPNSVAISMEIPADLKKDFQFQAGQYITIKHMLEGEEVRRAYSISSSTDHEVMTIGVKKVEGGKFSVYANTGLKEGDMLEVMPPEGRFTYGTQNGTDHVAAFAAGSGITPIMSIVKEVLGANDQNTMVLVYGNQNREETMFYNMIEELRQKYTERFFVQYVFSRAHEDNGLFGRIESSTVNFILKNKFRDRQFSAFYLCGPEPMIKAVQDSLEQNSVAQENIFTELFTSSESSAADIAIENGLTSVTVVLDDEEFSFNMDRKELVLDAVLDEDIDAPYSCQGGVCSTCIARVTEGSAVMEQNQILTDSEIAEGLILTCQSHPTSNTLKIDYDDV